MDKMKTMQNMFISHESRMLSWMRNAFIACIFCTSLGVPDSRAEEPGVAADSTQQAAMTVVKELHEKLMHIMQEADTLGYQGRYDYIQEVVTARFDTSLIAKVIMSRYWQ